MGGFAITGRAGVTGYLQRLAVDPAHRRRGLARRLVDDALAEGIKRANKTLKNVTGAWIQDQKVDVKKGKIVAYRVNMKVTFVLEE